MFPPKNYKSINTKAYDAIANVYKEENYESIFWLNEFKILLHLMKNYGIKAKGSKFLDLGCGTGRDTHLAINSGMKYVGIDSSKGMLRIARKANKEAKFFEMDALKLKFEDNEFDIVWASAILIHFNSYDLKKALKEIKRVLKPNDLAFISMQKRLKDDEAGLMKKSVKGKNTIKRYFALYAKEEFKKILEKANFSVIKTTSKIEPNNEKEWLCFFIKNQKKK